MRRRHFDALQPVCVVCRAAPVALNTVIREQDDVVIEGVIEVEGDAS